MPAASARGVQEGYDPRDSPVRCPVLLFSSTVQDREAAEAIASRTAEELLDLVLLEEDAHVKMPTNPLRMALIEVLNTERVDMLLVVCHI